MPLGGAVDLGPGDIVLDGDPAPHNKGHSTPPRFGPCILWPIGMMDQDATWYGGRPRQMRQCIKWRPSFPSPTEKDTAAPLFSPTSIVAKRSPMSATDEQLLKIYPQLTFRYVFFSASR